MKKLLSIIISLILFGFSAQGQTVFAPPGAEWYHTIGFPSSTMGVFHSYYNGDTVINGINCRKVAQIALTGDPLASMGFAVSNHPTQYFYNTEDTVFVYNKYFRRFTPLYVFNVAAGDTIKLPIYPDEMGIYTTSGGDSTFTAIVDSVSMVMYDTNNLKTVYTHGLDATETPGQYFVTHGAPNGAYAQRLGHLNLGIMPYCIRCAIITDDRLQPIANLRCYHDSVTSVQKVDMCGIPPVAIEEHSKENEIAIYPNPASERLIISGNSFLGNKKLSIFNMSGMQYALPYTNVDNVITVDVAALPNGIYLLQLSSAGEVRLYRKITVMH